MIITEPTLIENMELRDGLYRSTKDWMTPKKSGSYSACLHFDLKVLGVKLKYGSEVRMTWFLVIGGLNPVGNWKWVRMYVDNFGKPNVYAGTPRVELMATTEAARLYVENLYIDENTLKRCGVFPFGDGHYRRVQVNVVFPSAYARADGRFQIIVDDKTLLDHQTFKCEGAGYKDPKTMKVPEFKGLPSLFCIQATYQDNGTGLLPSTAYCHVAEPRIEIR